MKLKGRPERSYRNFVENTNALLKAKHWQRRELAIRTGIPRPNITKYLRGRTRPGLRVIDAIAKALGVSPARLISGPSDPEWVPLVIESTPHQALEVLKKHLQQVNYE